MNFVFIMLDNAVIMKIFDFVVIIIIVLVYNYN